MSGRSAITRKTKVAAPLLTAHQKAFVEENARRKAAGLELLPPPKSWEEKVPDYATSVAVSRHAEHQSAHLDGALYRATSGSSAEIAHLPSAYKRVARAPVVDLTTNGSQIEKSDLRHKYDSISDKIRNMSIKKKKKEPNSPRSSTATGYSPSISSPVQAPVSTAVTIVADKRHPNYLGRAMPRVKSEDSTVSLQVYRYEPRKPATVWEKMRRDHELWYRNGELVVYLTTEVDGISGIVPASLRLPAFIAMDNHAFPVLIDLIWQSGEDRRRFDGQALGSGMESPHPSQSDSMGRDIASPASANSGENEFRLDFRPSADMNKRNALRHQIAMRNMFALIYGQALVGFSLYQALSDLLERIEEFMLADADPAFEIIQYLQQKSYDDVRGDRTAAVSLLAFCENNQVQWSQGWREAFIHLVSMGTRIQHTADYKYLSPYTKGLLEKASGDLHIRIHHCQEGLGKFWFGDDMWIDTTPGTLHDARTAMQKARTFFLKYFKDAHGSWPPQHAEGETWLTRPLVQQLQEDFGALYNYIVNREVRWDVEEARAARKSLIVHENDPDFRADTKDLPFTDALVRFDNKNSYPHIPHPYPLVPVSQRPASKTASGAELGVAQRKIANTYLTATNIFLLGEGLRYNDLVNAFMDEEKYDCTLDPFDARRGRWLLIYAIVNTLASISADLQQVKYTEGCQYIMNPSLRGCPPWDNTPKFVVEDNHHNSLVWRLPQTWNIHAPIDVGPGRGSTFNPLGNVSGQRALGSSNYRREDSITYNGSARGSAAEGSVASGRRPYYPDRSNMGSAFGSRARTPSAGDSSDTYASDRDMNSPTLDKPSANYPSHEKSYYGGGYQKSNASILSDQVSTDTNWPPDMPLEEKAMIIARERKKAVQLLGSGKAMGQMTSVPEINSVEDLQEQIPKRTRHGDSLRQNTRSPTAYRTPTYEEPDRQDPNETLNSKSYNAPGANEVQPLNAFSKNKISPGTQKRRDRVTPNNHGFGAMPHHTKPKFQDSSRDVLNTFPEVPNNNLQKLIPRSQKFEFEDDDEDEDTTSSSPQAYYTPATRFDFDDADAAQQGDCDEMMTPKPSFGFQGPPKQQYEYSEPPAYTKQPLPRPDIKNFGPKRNMNAYPSQPNIRSKTSGLNVRSQASQLNMRAHGPNGRQASRMNQVDNDSHSTFIRDFDNDPNPLQHTQSAAQLDPSAAESARDLDELDYAHSPPSK